MMGYNTRRKSLSLPSLGVAVPNAARAQRPGSKPSPPDDEQQTSAPPLKKVKWSHGGRSGAGAGDDKTNNAPPSPISSTRSPVASPPAPMAAAPLPRMRAQHTPPPLPGDVVGSVRKVDTDGINDDIVVGVIDQLEKTGNRPHLIKDLATILAATNASVAQSANPAALLSSRLSLYLKRPWTALSPCPLAKELIPVHPRKVFYFLTTQPRMPLPDNSDDIIPLTLDQQLKRLTPSISNPSVAGDDDDDDDDDADADSLDRAADRFRSPSPEVELYSPELDDETALPPTPAEPFSGRSSLNPDGRPDMSAASSRNRAPSPALEADERGFTETATAVRARCLTLHEPPQPLPSIEVDVGGGGGGSSSQAAATLPSDDGEEETPEQQCSRDLKLACDLFGPAHVRLHDPAKAAFLSSPMIAAREDAAAAKASLAVLSIDHDMGGSGDDDDDDYDVMSPEMIDVDELDSMLTGY